MAFKNYYDLLGIQPTASVEEVKRVFRLQIARYHPDKVQHLGKEFQVMATERAAELTEAYCVLSDGERRGEYDRAREMAVAAPAVATVAPPTTEAARVEPTAAEPSAPTSEPGPRKPGGQFLHERASRDEFVRKATIERFRQALAALIGNSYDDTQVHGFDLACVPKSKLFVRTKGPRLLVRFVSRVDGEAVADAWAQAGKRRTPSQEDTCIFLVGPSIASPHELADAIARQRRKSSRGGNVTLIPIDVRDWDARVPTDAPAEAKKVLAGLRTLT